MTIYHPITTQIAHILREKGVWYETFEHEPVVTSEDAAKIRTGYTMSQGAKALIVNYAIQSTGDKKYVMFVLPGDRKLDNKKVKGILGVKTYSFADAHELSVVTGGVERGGVPPWGNLFGIPVYADISLRLHEKIIFNAGDRKFSIAMHRSDYEELVKPHYVEISADQ